MQLSSGITLQGGKYKINKALGQGGFGITYLASLEIESNQSLGKIRTTVPVTIKEFFMKEHCNRDASTSRVSISSQGAKELVENFKRKFIKEAQTLASLEHPNIVKIYDVFEENGTAYYAMEYIDGGSLSDYISQNGPMPEQTAIKYITQVAGALDYLHSRKMNHLDVKPGNILLNATDDAILIDFGLSKHYDDEGQATSTTPVGISHGYAPMEQYKRGGVNEFSPATDIYSLGATLYKLLTGQTPPDASDINDEGLPNIPNNISISTRQAIQAAMQSRRKDRPQSIKAFLAMFDNTETAEINDSKDEENTQINSTIIEDVNDKKTIENLKDVIYPQKNVSTKYGGSTVKNNKRSIWQIRNWFVNVVLIIALGLVVSVGIGTAVMLEGHLMESIYTILTSIGMGVGIIALLRNKRSGFHLMLLSTTIGCLLMDWTVGCFDIAYINFMYYISISMVLMLVFFIRKKKNSAWSKLEKNNFTKYKHIRKFTVLLIILTTVSQIIFPIKLSGRNGTIYDITDVGYLYNANDDARTYVRANYGYAYDQYMWGLHLSRHATNDEDAFQWILSSATQGFYHAQLKVAECYKNGEMVKRDRQESIKWFRKAYHNSQGDSFTKESAMDGLQYWGVKP